MDTKKTLDCKQYIKLEYTINVGTQSWLSCVKYINPLTKEIIVTYSMHSVQEDLDMSFFLSNCKANIEHQKVVCVII